MANQQGNGRRQPVERHRVARAGARQHQEHREQQQGERQRPHQRERDLPADDVLQALQRRAAVSRQRHQRDDRRSPQDRGDGRVAWPGNHEGCERDRHGEPEANQQPGPIGPAQHAEQPRPIIVGGRRRDLPHHQSWHAIFARHAGQRNDRHGDAVIAITLEAEPARQLDADQEGDGHSGDLHRAAAGQRADEERAEPAAEQIKPERAEPVAHAGSGHTSPPRRNNRRGLGLGACRSKLDCATQPRGGLQYDLLGVSGGRLDVA